MSGVKKIKALFLGAHPDDCEAGGAGLAAKLVRAGHEVKFCSLTDGRSGAYKNWGEAAKKLRWEDMQKVATFLGCEAEMLDNQDGRLQPTIEAREELIRVIRRYNPDLLFTHRSGDYHPDHHYTNVLTIDAAYMVKVPGICPDVKPMRNMPLILFYQDRFTKPYPLDPTIVIDISDVWEIKFKSLLLHEDQFFDWLPWADANIEDPGSLSREALTEIARKMIEPQNRESAVKYRAVLEAEYGPKTFTHAEAYEVAEHGAPLTPEIKALLLAL
jgi:LmbE family N-acetylglucosaminyl deacetylase